MALVLLNRPEAHAARRARLAVAVVGEFVVAGERLAAPRCPNAAREVFLAVDRAVEQAVGGSAEFLVTQTRGDGGHRGVEIRRPHGVTCGVLHFRCRTLRLVVGCIPARVIPCGYVLVADEVLRETDIFVAPPQALGRINRVGEAA